VSFFARREELAGNGETDCGSEKVACVRPLFVRKRRFGGGTASKRLTASPSRPMSNERNAATFSWSAGGSASPSDDAGSGGRVSAQAVETRERSPLCRRAGRKRQRADGREEVRVLGDVRKQPAEDEIGILADARESGG
jgi:hypothetical protein